MRRVLVPVVGLALAGVARIAPAGAGRGNVKRFCKANLQINQLLNEAPDPEESSPDEIEAFQTKLDRLLERAELTAPPEIADLVAAAARPLRADPVAGLEDPAVRAAANAIGEWAIENCGYKVVEVTAREYEFRGIPKTLTTGIVGFNFTNKAAELHEMVVVRITSDDTVEELLELPEEEADRRVEFMGGTFAVQGESGVAFIDFKKPGRYVAVCFVPVGTTSPDQEVDGPPHADEGMISEFKVKKK